MKPYFLIIGLFVLGISLFSGCKLADLRPDSLKGEIPEDARQKGKDLLQEVWKAHGMETAKTHSTYKVLATDNWKGLMGSASSLWPVNPAHVELKYQVGTFNGMVKFLEGEPAGDIAGLQAWKYYEKPAGEDFEFQEKIDPKISFGLAAYQYFFELPDRLLNVPTIAYGGTTEFEDQIYEVVFATWEKPEPNKSYDHYQLWIHPETHLIHFALYSIRENYLPAPANWHGSIRFEDYRLVDGVQIPFYQEVYLNRPGKLGSYIHAVTVDSFTFDSFPLSELLPDKELPQGGDRKLAIVK